MSRMVSHMTGRSIIQAVIAVFLILGTGGAWADEAAVFSRLEKEVLPLLEKYCVECHDADVTKADVNLHTLWDAKTARLDVRLWDKVNDQVATKQMPPAKKKEQPTEAERQVLTAWITEAQKAVASQPAVDPGYRKARRLTRREYSLTMRDLLYGAADKLGDPFPTDGAGGEGFDNNADTLFIPPLLIEKYIEATDKGLKAVYSQWETKKQIISTWPGPQKEHREAARDTLSLFARRAYRRPVTEADLTPLLAIYDQSMQRKPDYEGALKLAFKAVLLSPKFLILQEVNREGTNQPWQVSGHEMAQRLSYFLWSTMPDDELNRLADENKLTDPAVIEAQVKRMLKDWKADSFVRHFAAQWLGLDALFNTVDPDRGKYKEFTGSLRQALYDEGVYFSGAILRENGRVLDFLDSNYTYVNEELARLYEIPDVKGTQMRKVAFTNDRRGGVLGMGGMLAATAYPQRTSPVLRGKWVLETLLGTPAPPPPPNVGTLPEDDRKVEQLTFRQQLEKHRSKEACMGCHNRLDPPGFGLENFDPIGKWRDNENGKPLDVTGNFVDGRRFNGPAEMRRLLMSEKHKFVRNFSARLLGYALGRGLEPYDQPTLLRLEQTLVQGDYHALPVIVAVAQSYPFTHRRN
ncbi:DUF1592 domain-containing protein [Prosthecobacter debontii]|nr:DUF1592 domain-containing protein [Prosthecobacter debontii]